LKRCARWAFSVWPYLLIYAVVLLISWKLFLFVAALFGIFWTGAGIGHLATRGRGRP